MAGPARRTTVTFAEYLARERESSLKHEYLNGEIYAMAGGTPEHALICSNVIGELETSSAGNPAGPIRQTSASASWPRASRHTPMPA
jgi:Uma2 family endonuclease